MTAEELIKALQKFPGDSEVWFLDDVRMGAVLTVDSVANLLGKESAEREGLDEVLALETPMVVIG